MYKQANYFLMCIYKDVKRPFETNNKYIRFKGERYDCSRSLFLLYNADHYVGRTYKRHDNNLFAALRVHDFMC